MLELSGLSVAYGQHRTLEDAALRVGRGEIVVILGANGAGKSTLLKAVSGICEGRVEGSVTLEGRELVGQPPERIVEAGVALVPEGRGVFGDLSVAENLTLGAYAARARDREAETLQRVYRLFPKLAERRRQVVRTMSGGEQQMVAIGRAMMSNPMLLTLDEPSLGLSPLLCKELFQNLAAVRDLGIGILLVEQNARQSLAIADRGYLLENAHIVHEDRAAALMDDPAVQAAYLGASGAAAPHTYEDVHDTQPAVGAAPGAVASPGGTPPMPARSETPVPFAVPPRPRGTVAADEVLGRSVADLVSSASAASRQATEARRESMGADDVAAHGDRLATALAEIERAAARARARERRAARREHVIAPSEAAPASRPQPQPASPATIEIYRAPRVEVYRRRPGGAEFDRS